MTFLSEIFTFSLFQTSPPLLPPDRRVPDLLQRGVPLLVRERHQQMVPGDQAPLRRRANSISR